MNFPLPRDRSGRRLLGGLGLGLLLALGAHTLLSERPAPTAGKPRPDAPAPALASAASAPALSATLADAAPEAAPLAAPDPSEALQQLLRDMDGRHRPERLGPFFARHLTAENADAFLILLLDRGNWQEIAILFSHWAKLDPRDAFLAAFHSVSTEHYETSAASILDQWLQKAGPEAVFAELNTLKDPERIGLLLSALVREARHLPAPELSAWLDRWTEPRLRAEAEFALFSALAQRDPARGADLLAARSDYQLKQVLPLVLSRQWMVGDPAAAAAWTRTLPPDVAPVAFAEGIGALATVDLLGAEQVLINFIKDAPGGRPVFSPDPAVFELIIVLAKTQPEQAARWLDLIKDEKLNETGRQLLARHKT